MNTLGNLAKQLEEDDDVDNIREAISAGKRITGIDASSATVESLPGDTAGQYHTGSEQVKIDENIASSIHATHVVVHELFHKLNAQKAKARGEGLIETEALNEDLTEQAATDALGDTRIAYHEYKGETERIARAGSKLEGQTVTTNKVRQLYKEGENDKINSYIEASKMSDTELKAIREETSEHTADIVDFSKYVRMPGRKVRKAA